MMLLPAATLLVPTAQAAASTPSFSSVTVTIDGQPSTNPVIARIGSEVIVSGTVTADESGCSGGIGYTATKVKEVGIELLDMGISHQTKAPATDGTFTFTLSVPSTTLGTTRNGASVQFSLDAKSVCIIPTAGTEDATTEKSGTGLSPPFTLDNSPPSGTAAFSFITSGVDAGKFGITLNGLVDTSAATADARVIGGIDKENLIATSGATTALVVPTTLPGSAPDPTVRVTLKDASGNVQSAALASPLGLTGFQLYAMRDGIVRVEFGGQTPGNSVVLAHRQVGNASWSTQALGTTSPLTTVADPNAAGAFNVTGMELGKTYEVRIFQRDASGNDGVPTSLKTVRPAAAPNSVSFGASVPRSTGEPAIGTVGGNWQSASTLDEGISALRIALKNANGDFWQADATNSFSATPKWFPLRNDAGPSGTWTANNFTVGVAPKVAELPDGNYVLRIEFLSTGVPDAWQDYTFLLDKTPPANVTTGGSGFASGAPFFQQSRTQPRFTAAFKEEGSGFESVVFTLTRGSGATLTTIATRTCTLVDTASCSHTGAPVGTGNSWLNFTFSFAEAMPLGSGYALNAVVKDRAGNPMTTVSWPVVVVPRVALIDAPVKTPSGVVLYDQPFVNSANQLSFDVLAAFTAATAVDPSGPCAQNTCRVTGLEIQGANRSATGAGSGTKANPVVLANLPIPERGPDDFLADAGETALYWDHSPVQPVSIGSLEANYLDIRARATVKLDATTSQTFDTPWVRVLPPGSKAGIAFGLPASNSTVYLNSAAGKLTFNVTYDSGALTAAPTLKYSIWKNGTQSTYVGLDGTTQTSLFTRTVTAIDKAPFYFFNWSNTAALARGEYVMNVSAFKADGTEIPGAQTSRFFAVESQAVAVDFDLANSAIYSGRYVRPTFDLNVTVDHGFQNLSNAANFVPRLVATNTASGSTGTRTIQVGSEGFAYALKGLVPIDSTHTRAWLNITLPSNATDASRFDLRVNVSTDSFNGTNLGLANGTNIMTIVVDAVPPGAGVFLHETNVTGSNPADDLVIHGFASDAGSGVKDVQVRIYNVTGNTTYSAQQEKFVGGDQNLWLTTTAVNGHKVELDAPIGTQWFWRVRQSAGLPLDRTFTYRIDVRASDYLNPTPPEQSFIVHFDEVLPTVSTAPTQPPGGTGFVDWHGAGEIRVTAADNYCLRRVSLNATMPSGRVTGPFNMTAPATACPRSGTWTLDLAANPTATDEIGDVTYMVTAEDAYGNVFADTRTLTLKVNDTTAAEVRFLRLEPPLITPGSRSRVVGEIFENAGIEKVRVFFHRINPDNTYTLLAEGVARPSEGVAANGTGEWFAETDTDLNLRNLTLGDYLWEVRPLDTSWEKTCAVNGQFQCSQKSIIVRVVNDAGIFIQQESPAPGATFVNATPTFRFKVFDRNVTAGGITLRAGNSSQNLTAVTPTNVTDLPFVGQNRTGVVVEYRPNLTGQTGFALQLEAGAPGGLTNKTAVLSYAVDAIAPTVTANVTGAVDHANKTYAVAATRVNLTATDDHAVAITYRVNGGALQTYGSTPITPAGEGGEWLLEFFATDAAGNVARDSLKLSLDRAGPVINVTKHGDDLLVTVTDAGVGLNESTVKVFYKYGNESVFTTAPMTRTTGSTFRVQLTGNSTASGLKYYFEAKDVFGNVGTKYSAADPYVIAPEGPPANLAPKIAITSPTQNQGVRDRVDLRWLAEDPEKEELTITIALIPPSGLNATLLQKAGPNNGSYSVSVAGLPIGSYRLVVTASDGEKTNQDSVTFVVERGELVELLTPPPVTVEKDRLVPFAVRINAGSKTVSAVTYTLMRDNVTVNSGGMKLSQGSYTANLVTGEPGKYAVLVTVEYADGTSEPQKQVATFTVTGSKTETASSAFPASLITLVVLALVTIAVAAYAAFVRWPR